LLANILELSRSGLLASKRLGGENIEGVSRFLDHSSLGVTGVYLRRPEGKKDLSWTKVGEAICIPTS